MSTSSLLGARTVIHQDQFYLRTRPGTCMARMAAPVRNADERRRLQVVPGSGALPVLCAEKADTRVSFTDVTVPIPDGTSVAAVPMAAGDVLFFNGSLIHGSYPNRSADRFRRALIGHYIAGEAETVGSSTIPSSQMDGTQVELGVSEGGERCGVWT